MQVQVAIEDFGTDDGAAMQAGIQVFPEIETPADDAVGIYFTGEDRYGRGFTTVRDAAR